MSSAVVALLAMASAKAASLSSPKSLVSALEPFGLAPLEANACGTPVVAVAQGGVRETIIDGQNGFLCIPEAKKLAEKLEFLIDNPGRKAEIGRVALNNVQQNWTPEAAPDRFEGALLNTIKK